MTATAMKAECARCNKEIELTLATLEGDNDSMIAAVMERMLKRKIASKQVLCDQCDEIKKQEEAPKKAKSKEELTAEWYRVTPPEFRKKLNHEAPGFSKANLNKVLAWEYGPKGLLVYGKTGRCKTRFVYRLLAKMIGEGRTCEAVSHPQFRLRCSMAYENNRAFLHWWWTLLKCDVLFIDDLGKGHITPASEEFFCELVDYRMAHNKPTIYTTNDDMQTLQSRLSEDRGGPIIRRIVEFCIGVEFE